jgi:hypothetical protein
MRRVAWRPVLLAICALTALVQVASVLDVTGMGGAPPWWGRLGATFDATSGLSNIVVRSVEPGGPAALAGLREGDLIDVRANTVIERLAIAGSGGLLNGQPLILSVHRGSLQKELTIIPRPLQATRYWDFLLGSFGGLWLLLFAALIAWRRAEMPQIRLLSLWLAVFVVVGATTGFAAPWTWLCVLFNISGAGLGLPLALGLWAALAGCFAQPLSRLRRIAQWLCYTFVAISIANSGVWIFNIITLHLLVYPNVLVWFVPFVAAVLMAVVCSVLAIAASRGVERQRAVWTIVPLASILCSFIVVGIAISGSSSYANAIVLSVVANLVILAAPLALTYAALSRRLIDVGFVLNRALIFAIVSTIVIGAFVLVEWAASGWFVSASHPVSIVISMGVALGLGLSIRYIHKHVDRFVDRVFFRKRYEDEAALRRFAHESSYITDRSILLERAVREVKEHTNAAETTILVQDGAAAYTSAEGDGARAIGENDPAMLALRAWHKPVDLRSFDDSVLHGEFAFPMVSRGALVGVLVCGAKRDGEAYAPDESEALLALAHGVGTALDVLSAQRDRSNELVLSKLEELHEDVKRDRPSELIRRMLAELREDLKRMSRP